METNSQIELKYLAPYLPYGLKYLYLKKGEGIWMDPDKNHFHTLLSSCEKGYHSKSDKGVIMFYENPFNKKLILRPISDLKNEEFEMDSISKGAIMFLDETANLPHNSRESHIGSIQYKDMVFLLENHFDIFGLIRMGLAIDINTIKI